MILGNIENLETEINTFPEAIKKGLKYLKGTDFSKLEEGKYEIEGEKLFIIIQKYKTKNIEEKEAEKHEKYIDIQYIISGEEIIGFGSKNPKNELIEEYNEEKERSKYRHIENETKLILSKGMYAIFFPEDIHRPGCNYKKETEVKKAVVKISTDLI